MEKFSKHQFASMKSWLNGFHFMLYLLDISIQTFGKNQETFRILAVNSMQAVRCFMLSFPYFCTLLQVYV